MRILEDLKEARDRLNQTSANSSRPPSSRAAWEGVALYAEADEADKEEAALPEEADEALEKPPPERHKKKAAKRDVKKGPQDMGGK